MSVPRSEPAFEPAFDMVGAPESGRTFTGRRAVRLGDASPGGRVRLDSLARYLQDVSDDDTTDAGLDSGSWVVRRTVLRVDRSPVYLEPLTLRTWCSATGARWAERRVSIDGGRGGRVEAASLWVALDPASGRPAKLTGQFMDLFAPSTAGRTVSARMLLPGAPAADVVVDPVAWRPRFADFDVLGHVNNAAYWTVLEELLVRRRELRAPLLAIVEHAQPIEPDVEVRVVAAHGHQCVDAWITAATDGRALAALHVRTL